MNLERFLENHPDLANEIDKFQRMSRGKIDIHGESLPQNVSSSQSYTQPPMPSIPNPPTPKSTVTAMDIAGSLGEINGKIMIFAEKLAKLKNERNYLREQHTYWYLYGDRSDILIHSPEWKKAQAETAKATKEMHRIDAEIFDIIEQIESLNAAPPPSEEEIHETKALISDGVKRATKLQTCISCGYNHIVGLKADGTVVEDGKSESGNSKNLKEIIAVAAGSRYTLGLKSDGTVDTVKGWSRGDWLEKLLNDVGKWRDITAISTGSPSFGLKSDGTVVTAKSSAWAHSVNKWRNITAISAGGDHIVGLKKDGTVVAASESNMSSACEVSSWKNIVAVSAGSGPLSVGLKSDGTVVVAAHWLEIRTAVKNWSDIIAIATGNSRIYGLKSDGTVVTTSEQNDINVSSWRDIIAISAGDACVLGLKSDRTVVVTGKTGSGLDDDKYYSTINWRMISPPSDKQIQQWAIAAEERKVAEQIRLEEERKKEMKRKEEEERRQEEARIQEETRRNELMRRQQEEERRRAEQSRQWANLGCSVYTTG